MTEAVHDSWQRALTRRLRTLLRMVPLHRLEAGKGRRELALDDQDLRALALRALDLTIERMGLGSGPSYRELVDALVPLARACDSGLDEDAAGAIARVVLDELLNERDRRRAFREPYLAVDEAGVARRQLDFHLLQEHAAADGTIVLRATTEAINLYAGMLEYPVEDAQVAEEAVLRSQVARGRIADAVQTARRARLRSIEYEQKILTYLETTRRDACQIDWVREVLGLLRDAREHIRERIAAEGELIEAVEQRLEHASAEGGAQLAALRDTLDECLARHLRLQERLIAANQDYLDEHDRQAFRPRPLAPLPDLEADVLRQALALPCGLLAARVDWLLARFQAPAPPPTLHLASLVDRLLAPRRHDEDEPLDLTELELEAFDPAPPRFSDDDHRLVERLLAGLREPCALSELLARARDQGAGDAAERLLVAHALWAFDPRASSRLTAEALGRPLGDARFHGDDLRLEVTR